MKYLPIVVGFLALLTACSGEKSNGSSGNEQETALSTDVINNPATADESVSPEDRVKLMPAMQFEYTKHDFGKIHAGEKVSYSFKFTNTGKGDLIITDASASCGCTVPEFPKEPIPPGGTGEIPVSFTKHQTGNYDKQVTITANTSPSDNFVFISAEVIP